MSPRPPRWNEITALFGGRFDPPHMGHLEAVRGLFAEPGVKRVLVLPSPVPPHKASIASNAQRAEMARVAFETASWPGEVRIDLREFERAKRAPGNPSYTFDTLQEIRREYPAIAFVVGTDQLRDFPSWYRFPDVLSLSHWIVLERKPGGESAAAEGVRVLEGSGILQPAGDRIWRTPGGTYLKRVVTPAFALSSTEIRERIARTGQPPEGSLTQPVKDYLKLHRIYGTKEPA